MGEEKYKMREVKFSDAGIFLVLFVAFFYLIARKMGGANMVSTMMATAFDLLMNTVFYIMAIAVFMGAISELLNEFGVVALVNKLISPLMMPIYGLPGASVVGIFATYFSDNAAILTLADNDNFKGYFKKYQYYALTNIGTAFGMGLIVSAFIIGIRYEQSLILPVAVGNISAIIGSIVSTRLMLRHTIKEFGTEAGFEDIHGELFDVTKYRMVRSGNLFNRFFSAALEGGAKGVDMGLGIIPGVIFITTFVQILSQGPGPEGVYTGAAYEGVRFSPWLGDKLNFIISPLLGFTSPEAIAVTITALGAAGAAMALIPNLLTDGLIDLSDVAVMTAMLMCWSGYLSTHMAMMDALGRPDLAGKGIAAHTIGGLSAGVVAHLIYKLIMFI